MAFQVSRWPRRTSGRDRGSPGPVMIPGMRFNLRKQVKVLVVEDDDDLRWLICDELRGEGLDVIGCAGAREVVRQNEWTRALVHDPSALDVVVADLRLGEIDGLALLQRIADADVDLPVVMISAFADVDTRARAGELGAAAFLDKPVAMEKLRNLVCQLGRDHQSRIRGTSYRTHSTSGNRSNE